MNYPESTYGMQFQCQPEFQCCQSSLQFFNSSNPSEYPYQCQFMRPYLYYPTYQCQPQSVHCLCRHQCPYEFLRSNQFARMHRIQCRCQQTQKNMNQQANGASPFKAKNQRKTRTGTETKNGTKTRTIDKAAFPLSESSAAPASTPPRTSASLPMLPQGATNSASLESTSASDARRESKNSPPAQSSISKYSLSSKKAPVSRQIPAPTRTSRYPPTPARERVSRHSASPTTMQASRKSLSPEKTLSRRSSLSPEPGRISRYQTESASRNFRASVPERASKYSLAPMSAPVENFSLIPVPRQASRNSLTPAPKQASRNSTASASAQDSAYIPAKYTQSPPQEPCDELMLTASECICVSSSSEICIFFTPVTESTDCNELIPSGSECSCSSACSIICDCSPV